MLVFQIINLISIGLFAFLAGIEQDSEWRWTWLLVAVLNFIPIWMMLVNHYIH